MRRPRLRRPIIRAGIISLDLHGRAWQWGGMKRRIILGLVLLALVAWLLLVTLGEVAFR